MNSSILRHRLSRREWLTVTAAGVGTVSASGWLPVLAANAAKEGVKHKSCILLYMLGGPSHIDTFDPKYGTETATEFRPIATSVPGLQISEHLPGIAKLLHHGAVIRSMSTAEADHDRGRYLMHTGYPRGSGGVPWPSMGALVSSELGQPGFLLPNFVVLNLKDRLDPTFTGYLAPEHKGLILPDLDRGIEDVKPFVKQGEFDDRLDLLTQLDDAFRGKYRAPSTAAHQSNYRRAADLMRAEQLKAFDLTREPAATLSRYTTHPSAPNDVRANARRDFGKGCLLARRLVEVGVPFVEVVLTGWDTHANNFAGTKLLSEVLDPAWSALIEDLKERGLLDRTLVIWMGEFGRTPRINPSGGRDHYARAWSTVLMGGGIKGGQVIGRTDKDGAIVEDRPVSAGDFMATVCEILGINSRKVNKGPGDRTVRLTDKAAKPIQELISS
jgi:hypothetical protein